MSIQVSNQFQGNAELFPHLLDIPSDQIMLSQLSEADYKKASFLDQRLLTPQLPRQTTTWSALEGVDIGRTLPPFYIFHIGHVGSTLISRFLGELPNVLALREPQILRDLAEISQIKHLPQSPWSPQVYVARTSLVSSWLSRTFHDNQRAMIKASSFVSEIANEFIGEANTSLFLYVSLNSYLETILAGEGSRQEASQLAGARLVRLNKRLGGPIDNLWQLSHIQQIALGWLCEMSTLMQTYENGESQAICWLNFDTFLKDPVKELVSIAKHFDLNLDTAHAQKLVTGPIMNSYSKAPEHDYSPNLRKQLLQQARQNFGPQITHTLNWVSGLAKTHPLIETIVSFADKDA